MLNNSVCVGLEYKINDLEVIGYLGNLLPSSYPLLLREVFAKNNIFFAEYKLNRKKGTICSDLKISQKEFDEWVARGFFTRFGPVPASIEKCLYVAPKSSVAKYITWTEAAKNFDFFANKKRQLGDKCFKSGDYEKAEDLYALAASASESAVDFARMLLCNPFDLDKNLLKWIKKQGYDPKKLMRSIKREIQLQP